MTRQELTHRHPTGELCPGCDREIVISTQAAGLLLECDCGSVAALGPPDEGLSPAA